ncbi:MAG: hypothetical protein HQK53_11245 [Oligoflexia bacterium]|nr:hypothetical protein [Oligoflexia bacterium]
MALKLKDLRHIKNKDDVAEDEDSKQATLLPPPPRPAPQTLLPRPWNSPQRSNSPGYSTQAHKAALWAQSAQSQENDEIDNQINNNADNEMRRLSLLPSSNNGESCPYLSPRPSGLLKFIFRLLLNLL